METGPKRLAAYVRLHAPAAGYDLEAFGETARLARDADMDKSTLTRLLKGERLPQPKALWPLAKTLGRPYPELLVEGGIIPAESLAHMPEPGVASTPITAADLSDQWGVTDPKSRELVEDMLARVRQLAQAPQDTRGSAEAG